MKKIKKAGRYPKMPDEINFECALCDCIFSATKEDWTPMVRERGYPNEPMIDLMTFCPECGSKVHELITIEK